MHASRQSFEIARTIPAEARHARKVAIDDTLYGHCSCLRRIPRKERAGSPAARAGTKRGALGRGEGALKAECFPNVAAEFPSENIVCREMEMGKIAGRKRKQKRNRATRRAGVTKEGANGG